MQHITTPLPFSMSAFWSARIGTSKLNNGTFAIFPTNSFALLSFGFMKRDTQAGNNSGLVVAMIRSFSPTLNMMSLKYVSQSLLSNSTWAIVVWQLGHHRAGESVLYSLFILYKSMKLC